MSSTQLETFAQAVSSSTGIDPRVIEAQAAAEGNPGNEPGYFNWLNIPTSTAQTLPGVKVTGTGPAGTAMFGSLAMGEIATDLEYKNLGLGAESGKTVQQQIADIANSPWASSHYGGPGGPNLTADFVSRFGQAALAGPAQPAPPGFINPNTGAPIAGTTSPTPSGLQSATSTAQGAVSGVTGAVSSVGSELGSIGSSLSSTLSFVFSYRFLEILGGVVLVALGVVLVGRQLAMGGPASVAAKL